MNPNNQLIKCYQAGADVAPYLIVKIGASAGYVVPAAAETDKLLGVANSLNITSGDRVDIVQAGIAEVTCGDVVAFGDWLTTDANGKAVATTTAGDELIGKALSGGVAEQVIPVLIQFGRY
ncbi:DUF2190 family protein [Beggiatoa leptomitoformis]|uniref:DUF2190 family protein n=1 Tax=Beggiatoa leptomitoformis TaxID=288004 RepID=A0A2N9YH78_9GAMM|nr:DUF2190 family protein [Beggiatoa leptomitoformis]ALG67879.1 DUF2190 family protein [Beggiatoa leptomitoformis]AUI69860.1 DUF2190 family protein [Beggiatoa leptomitoformis]